MTQDEQEHCSQGRHGSPLSGDDASDDVDIVAVDGSGGVLFGECKWGSVARDDLQKLERRANLILPHLEGVRTVALALFSASGIADAVVQQRVDAGEVLHFSADDLFAANHKRRPV